MSKSKGSAPCIMVNIDDLLYTIGEVIENEDNPMMFIEMIRCLAIFGKERIDSDSLPKPMKPYYRLLRKTVESGFESFDSSQVESKYGGYKSSEINRLVLKGYDRKEAEKQILSLSEWWARQEGYSDEVGRGKAWYEPARAIREELYSSTPDDTQVHPSGGNNKIELDNNKIQLDSNRTKEGSQGYLKDDKQTYRIHDKYGGQNFAQKKINIEELSNLI